MNLIYNDLEHPAENNVKNLPTLLKGCFEEANKDVLNNNQEALNDDDFNLIYQT